MAILQLVDQMSELLSEGREVPLSRYRMVDAEEFSQMLERMRISVPSSIRESERTLIERDNILAQARAEADKIIQDASDLAANMLSDNSLVILAHQEAQRIIEDGHEVARQRSGEADVYATQVLQDLHEKLLMISGQVENGVSVMLQNQQQYTPPAPQPNDFGMPAIDRQPTQHTRTPLANFSSDPYEQDSATGYDKDNAIRFDERPLSERAADVSTFDRSQFDDHTPSDQKFTDGRFGDTDFDESKFGDSRFDDSRFDDSRFDDSRFDDTKFDDSRFDDTRFDSSRFDNSSSDDSPLQAPMLNYLSNPSDQISDDL